VQSHIPCARLQLASSYNPVGLSPAFFTCLTTLPEGDRSLISSPSPSICAGTMIREPDIRIPDVVIREDDTNPRWGPMVEFNWIVKTL
jgi:hypothetical protein